MKQKYLYRTAIVDSKNAQGAKDTLTCKSSLRFFIAVAEAAINQKNNIKTCKTETITNCKSEIHGGNGKRLHWWWLIFI